MISLTLWHDNKAGQDQELHEFLGMTWDEYSVWVTKPSVFLHISYLRGLKAFLCTQNAEQDEEHCSALVKTASVRRKQKRSIPGCKLLTEDRKLPG
jgi:hypothetical protein